MPTQKQNNSRKLKSRSRKRTYRRSKSIISKRSIKKKTKRKSYDGASSSSAYFAIPKIIENICDDVNNKDALYYMENMDIVDLLSIKNLNCSLNIKFKLLLLFLTRIYKINIPYLVEKLKIFYCLNPEMLDSLLDNNIWFLNRFISSKLIDINGVTTIPLNVEGIQREIDELIDILTSQVENIIFIDSTTTILDNNNINVLHCTFNEVHNDIRIQLSGNPLLKVYVTPLQIQEDLPDWLKNIVLYGFHKNIGNQFCYNKRYLINISYKGMSSLQTIGDEWMANCHTLQNPSFVGLSALTKVGNYWMWLCAHLENPNFNGLSALTKVGNYWMWLCEHLENPNFNGLSALTTVGNNWMRSCDTLQNPNFNDLSALTTVGNDWMSNCHTLQNPNFNSLSSLITVGDDWMSRCFSLQNPNFVGLSALITIGDFWMLDCIELINPNFNGLLALTTVGNSWMRNCDVLENPDFDGLLALTTVGDDWMEFCPVLSEDIKQFRDDFLRDHNT